MKMNIQMEPRECVMEESHSRLYPVAGFGSGIIICFVFYQRGSQQTVMQDSDKHNSSVQSISLVFLFKQSKTYIYIYMYDATKLYF